MLRASTSIRRFLCSISNKWMTIPSPLIIIVVVFILSFFYLICWTCCWKLPIVSSQQTLIEIAQEVKYTQVLNKLIEWLTKSSLHPTSIVTSKLESPHGDLERKNLTNKLVTSHPSSKPSENSRETSGHIGVVTNLTRFQEWTSNKFASAKRRRLEGDIISRLALLTKN